MMMVTDQQLTHVHNCYNTPPPPKKKKYIIQSTNIGYNDEELLSFLDGEGRPLP